MASSKALPEPRIGPQPPRPKTDIAIKHIADFVLRGFYRDIDVIGVDNLPKSGPVIVVANHYNSLADGVLILACLPRMPRFLASSTIWDYQPLRPFLNAAGVVPLFRKSDGRGDQGSMAETFSMAAQLLNTGGVLAIFPEGLTHDHPYVQPFKTGTARIALKAAVDHAPLDVKIVPVALSFNKKYRIRSKACMEIGPPLSLRDEWVAAARSDDPVTQFSPAPVLTRQMHQSVEDLVPSFSSWHEMRMFHLAGRVLLRPNGAFAPSKRFSSTVMAARNLHRAYGIAREHNPEMATEFWDMVCDYNAALRSSWVRDDYVGHPDLNADANNSTAERIVTLIGAFIITTLGIILNGLPGLAVWIISRGRPVDKKSTWAIFAALILLPIIWVLNAVLAGFLWGQSPASSWILGGLVFAAGPLSCWYGLRVFDYITDLTTETWARFQLRTNGKWRRILTQKRAALSQQIFKITGVDTAP